MPKKKIIFSDTESCGFYGPTILIQTCIEDGPPAIHNIWKHTVRDTLNLIEYHMENNLVGFNWVHDSFHYTRTYNVLSNLPKNYLPDPVDYLDVESESLDKYCLKPFGVCDLMLIGRKTKFQATMNQKSIYIRKVPVQLATFLARELKEKIDIPSIYFAKKKKGYEWRITPLVKGTSRKHSDPEEEVDPDFVNIELDFSPSASLKNIMTYLGKETETIDDLDPLPKVEEYSWWPSSGHWIDVFRAHLHGWDTDPRRIKYALNDPVYTRDLWHYLEKPGFNDVDSQLAFSVGGEHWKGFAVDIEGCKTRKKEKQKIFYSVPINVNSPLQVKRWLHEVCSPMERVVITGTNEEILMKISTEQDWIEDNPEVAQRAKSILDARRAGNEIALLNKLIAAGRLHAPMKITGTKSNRMGGGSMNKSKGGSINLQGIKKGDMRSLFPLAFSDFILCGGDFSGFEVAIAEAVYRDPVLRTELLSGKKMHGLFGAEMLGMSYDDIMATEDNNKNDPDGYYGRAKTAFFAVLYGAEAAKIAQALWVTKEEAQAGLDRFLGKYKTIREARAKLKERFTAITQLGDIGSEIVWQDPDEYVESFLGFRRYFTLEFKIMRCLFNMAQDPSDEFKELGMSTNVVRRNRVQTASGATMSALFAVVFGIQGQVFRAAANHEMQSPGGEITKNLQAAIWSIQPVGIGPWLVMPMNIHDEVECPCVPSVMGLVEEKVNECVESYRDKVPLIKMKWKKNLKTWGDK